MSSAWFNSVCLVDGQDLDPPPTAPHSHHPARMGAFGLHLEEYHSLSTRFMNQIVCVHFKVSVNNLSADATICL